MSQIRKSSSAGPTGAVYDMSQYRTRTASAAAQGVEATDQAAVSDSARELSKARGVVESSADVRTGLIESLRLSIAEGKYQPDPREIARKIMERGL